MSELPTRVVARQEIQSPPADEPTVGIQDLQAVLAALQVTTSRSDGTDHGK